MIQTHGNVFMKPSTMYNGYTPTKKKKICPSHVIRQKVDNNMALRMAREAGHRGAHL